MPNTYTQLYIQFVFAVKGRQSLMSKEWNESLYKYITGIVQNNKSKMLCINGVSDHVHIFIGYHPAVSIPDLVKDIKIASSLWINDNKLVIRKFNWQEGYGAFSYSRSQLDAVCNYIKNQEVHHKKNSFKEEYMDFLRQFEVAYDEKYLFEFIDL
jgi:putative transposase